MNGMSKNNKVCNVVWLKQSVENIKIREGKPIFMEEHILLSLYHNTHHNYLVVTPGENDIESNSYQVNGVPGFEYGVEIVMQEENGEDMALLIKNLLRKWEKKYKKQLTFSFPPLGKKTLFVSFEIVSAVDFDIDTAYIEYYIKSPDYLKITGELRGRTHRAHFIENNEKKFWRYGHTVDLEMECATGIDPQPLKIYLEAISVDWWGRHRTEGYSNLSLTLQPGRYSHHLSCLRPEEKDHVVAETRKFFVGGCHLIKNLTALDNTHIEDPSFRFVSTGSIYVRWNVISQRPSPSRLPSTPHSSSSELLRGAEAVLRQYKKAKATLAIAAGLAMDGSGDG
ncbi:Meckel syndrome type 1 protein [Danaus plexippus plexippus]|uniref:Meckel syndrome type 1 protein n=1 Tax=Danaus plexippus plexippus TaxID=278856 RepID=A0A212FMW5_DANPL|nr:Meckel syndrome type 1 protein [Danaus plexippus plexippus]